MLCPCTVTFKFSRISVFLLFKDSSGIDKSCILAVPADCALAVCVYVDPLLCLENKMAFISFLLAAPVIKSMEINLEWLACTGILV